MILSEVTFVVSVYLCVYCSMSMLKDFVVTNNSLWIIACHPLVFCDRTEGMFHSQQISYIRCTNLRKFKITRNKFNVFLWSVTAMVILLVFRSLLIAGRSVARLNPFCKHGFQCFERTWLHQKFETQNQLRSLVFVPEIKFETALGLIQIL